MANSMDNLSSNVDDQIGALDTMEFWGTSKNTDLQRSLQRREEFLASVRECVYQFATMQVRKQKLEVVKWVFDFRKEVCFTLTCHFCQPMT